MTNARLRFRLIASAVLILAILAASLAEYAIYGKAGSNFIGSNGTLIAIIFASYIAYSFQQRAKLADDVRKWWSEIVNAKSEFFIYCDKQSPTEDEYLKAFYKLSSAMDNLRAVYCNVHRSQNEGVGYYPFEQVRDIIDVAQSVPPGPGINLAERQMAKIAIITIFGSLRHAIQSEATSLTPDNPILFNSSERKRYVEQIKEKTGIELDEVRVSNKVNFIKRQSAERPDLVLDHP